MIESCHVIMVFTCAGAMEFGHLNGLMLEVATLCGH